MSFRYGTEQPMANKRVLVLGGNFEVVPGLGRPARHRRIRSSHSTTVQL
jgi:hypothetical protein